MGLADLAADRRHGLLTLLGSGSPHHRGCHNPPVGRGNISFDPILRPFGDEASCPHQASPTRSEDEAYAWPGSSSLSSKLA